MVEGPDHLFVAVLYAGRLVEVSALVRVQLVQLVFVRRNDLLRRFESDVVIIGIFLGRNADGALRRLQGRRHAGVVPGDGTRIERRPGLERQRRPLDRTGAVHARLLAEEIPRYVFAFGDHVVVNTGLRRTRVLQGRNVHAGGVFEDVVADERHAAQTPGHVEVGPCAQEADFPFEARAERLSQRFARLGADALQQDVHVPQQRIFIDAHELVAEAVGVVGTSAGEAGFVEIDVEFVLVDVLPPIDPAVEVGDGRGSQLFVSVNHLPTDVVVGIAVEEVGTTRDRQRGGEDQHIVFFHRCRVFRMKGLYRHPSPAWWDRRCLWHWRSRGRCHRRPCCRSRKGSVRTDRGGAF